MSRICQHRAQRGGVLSFSFALTASLTFLISANERIALAADKPADPMQAQIGEYRDRVAKGEADKVVEECTKAIASDAKNFAAHVGLGAGLHAQGKYRDAINEFDKALKVEGQSPAALTIRAQAYLNRSLAEQKLGEYLAAVDSCYYSLLERPSDPETHTVRAMAYIGWNRLDKAISSTYRALQIDPKYADALSVRGYVYGLKGDYSRDIDDQTKALAANPKLAVALERRAAAQIAKGKAADAAKDIEAALKLDPKLAEAYCDRAMLYASRKNYQQAMADLDEAIRVDPSCLRARFLYAQAMKSMKKGAAAIESITAGLEFNGRWVEGLNLRGDLYLDEKDYAKAVEDFSKAISIDPQSADAYRGRSQAYRRLGKEDQSKGDLTKVRELVAAEKKESKDKKDKKDEDPPVAFKMVSKGVDPNRRSQAIEAARHIDELIEANYKKNNVTPNPATDDAQFVRRIYLDITGTIPSYQQARSFLLNKDPNKREKLIDDLLGDVGYASHMFNYWADVLRYTDRLHEDVGGEPYRQWIKQSLAENKPWDQFVTELVTAEGLIWENPATGYTQRDANMPLDSMNNTVRIFCGTRIGCAQCHNHPFDKWTQKEFYQMAAFTYGTASNTYGGDKRYWESDPRQRLMDDFEGIEQEEEDRRRNYYRFGAMIRVNMRIVNDQNKKIQLPKDYAYSDAKPNSVVAPKTIFGKQVEIRNGETPRHAFARWLTSKDNPRFARTIANRLWKLAFGAGVIEPVDDMTDYTVPENPALMDYLESQMKDLDFDMKEYLRIVFNTKAYQRQACHDEIPVGTAYHFPGPMLRRMTAEQVWDSFLTMTLQDPYEYREPDASLRTQVISADLEEISAEKLLASGEGTRELDSAIRKWQDKHKYKGVLLARASELPSPNPANHFLRMFGQSDRQQISASSTGGSVPQVLFMFNGPITHMMLEPNTTLYNNVMRKQSVEEGIKAVFLTVLSREPDSEDMSLAEQEIAVNGPAGYGNVIWSLVNTREFLFVQ
jgi:tetratricopeptide (TPR) repeat protein